MEVGKIRLTNNIIQHTKVSIFKDGRCAKMAYNTQIDEKPFKLHQQWKIFTKRVQACTQVHVSFQSRTNEVVNTSISKENKSTSKKFPKEKRIWLFIKISIDIKSMEHYINAN